MAFNQQPEKVEEVSGFADRGLDKLRSLLQSKPSPSTASVDRVDAPREAAPAEPVKARTAGPKPVEDRVTLGQQDDHNEDNGMNWLNNLTANYG